LNINDPPKSPFKRGTLRKFLVLPFKRGTLKEFLIPSLFKEDFEGISYSPLFKGG